MFKKNTCRNQYIKYSEKCPRECAERNLSELSHELTTNLSAPFAFSRVNPSAHFLILSDTTHLPCLQLIIQCWLFFLLFCSPPFSLSACFPLILSQPRGLPAITPPVHQHRGQEGGIYADIWTVIPTIHAVCQCTAGSSLQHAHTPVPKLRTLQPYGQEIRLTSQ